MKRWIATFGVLLIASLAYGQSPTVTKQIQTTTCPGDGCVALGVQGLGAVAVQVVGTPDFVGTAAIETSIDGVTYSALIVVPSSGGAGVSSVTAAGLWNGNIAGFSQVRVRFSAYTSGLATVTIAASTAGQSATALLTSNNVWTGTETFNGAITFGGLSTGLLNSTAGLVSVLAPTDDNLVVGSGTAWQLKALTTCTGTGKAVTYDASANTFGCNTISGGSPAGSDTYVQYNNAGAFGAEAAFAYNAATNTLAVENIPAGVAQTLSFQTADPFGDPGFLISADGDYARVSLYSAGTTGYPEHSMYSSRGTRSSPTGVHTSDQLGTFYSFALGDVPSGFDYAFSITPYATENWTDTGHGSYVEFVANKNGEIGYAAPFLVFDGASNLKLGRTDMATVLQGTRVDAPTLGLTVTAIGSLPTCNGGSEGSVRGVNDALLPAALAIVAAGGAVHVPVYCDGTNWRVM